MNLSSNPFSQRNDEGQETAFLSLRTQIANEPDKLTEELIRINKSLLEQKEVKIGSLALRALTNFKQPCELYNLEPKKWLWVFSGGSPDNRDSGYYSDLNQLINELDSSINLSDQDSNTLPTALKKIKKIYNDFISKCVCADEQERLLLLESRTRISGELGFRYLNREIAQNLKDKINRLQGPASLVEFDGLIWKFKSVIPGIEKAADFFLGLISPFQPSQKYLLKIQDVSGVHLGLISKSRGTSLNLDGVLKESPDIVIKINPTNFSAMFMLGILTNPADGNPANFLLTPGNQPNNFFIMRINQGKSFCQQRAEGNISSPITVNNVLYLFPQMDHPIDPTFRDYFLALSPEYIIIAFLKSIADDNEAYQQLVDQGALSKEDLQKLTLPTMINLDSVGQKRFVETLYEKLCCCQKILRENPLLSHREFFLKIDPLTCDHYQPFYEQSKNGKNIRDVYASLESQYPPCPSSTSDLTEGAAIRNIHMTGGSISCVDPKIALESFVKNLDWGAVSCEHRKPLFQFISDVSYLSHLEIPETFLSLDHPPVFLHNDEFDYTQPLVTTSLSSPILIESEFDKRISLILSYIHQAKKTLEQVRNKEIFCCIGNTGSGKSTAINYLHGCRMFESDPPPGLLERVIEAENPVVKIGHNDQSETLIPFACSVRDSNVILCDMPGYLENRSSEINIANSVNIRDIANQASIKLFFLVNYHSLKADRGEGLKNSIQILIDFFGGSVERLNESMKGILIGVTRIPKKAVFNNVKGEILRIARESRWELENHLGQIIQIDPLEKRDCPKRLEVLSIISAMPPVPSTEQLFQTAIRPADELLIGEIAKRITERVDQFWVQGDIYAVFEEFKKIYSLKGINQSAITNAIQNLQLKMMKAVDEMVERILLIGQLDQPQMRLETIDKMKKLEKCCLLDGCFQPENGVISSKFQGVKKELEVIEQKMQKKSKAEIEAISVDYYKGLNRELTRLLGNRETLEEFVSVGGKLTSKEKIEGLELEVLLKVLGASPIHLTICDQILEFLSKIDLEKKNRINKYYFGDLLPLDPLLEEFQGKLTRLILDKIKESKILRLNQSIESAINELTNQIDSNLSVGLTAQKLNNCYQQLFALHPESYEHQHLKAKRFFIENSERELDLVLTKVDSNYVSQLKKIRRTITCLQYLNACFKCPKEYSAIKIRIRNKIKESESLRREEELKKFTTISTFLEIAKTILKDFTFKNPESINQWVSIREGENPFDQLKDKLDGLSPFADKMRDLELAIENQKSKYFYSEENELETLLMTHNKDLINFLVFIKSLAEALLIETKINSILDFFDKQVAEWSLVKLKNLVKYGVTVQSSFGREDVSELNRLCGNLKQFVSQHSESREILGISEGLEKKMALLLLSWKEKSEKMNADFIGAEIDRACLQRDFLRILTQLPSMLDVLQKQNQKNYESVIQRLNTSIAAWHNSDELRNSLEAKNYRNVVNMYVTLEKLQFHLRNHKSIVIDIDSLKEDVRKQIDRVYTRAVREIKNDQSASSDFFNLDELKTFLEILTAFKNLKIPNNEYFELQNIAREGWLKVVEISYLDLREENELEKTAKKMIKHHAIARQLSLLSELENFQSNLLRELIQPQFIYPLGLKIEEIGNREHFIKADAESILKGHGEFKTINIKAFNRKAGGISVEEALSKLRCFPTCPPESVDKLKEAYNRFAHGYSQSISKIIARTFDLDRHTQEILRMADDLNSPSISFSRNETGPVLLAHIAALWTYLSSGMNFIDEDKNTLLQPHTTQILALLRMIGIDQEGPIKDHLAEIKTGEGKSVCLGILSAFFALQQYRVSVVCYSTYLSKRDKEAFGDLFKRLFISHRVSYCTYDKLVGNTFGQDLPDFSDYVLSFLKKEAVAPFSPSRSGKKLLLIDEVDVFFGEHFYGRLRGSSTSIASEDVEELIRYAWINKDDLKKLNPQEAHQQLLDSTPSKKILANYPNLVYFFPKKIDEILTALRSFPESGEILHKCTVKDDKIGYIDKTGNLRLGWTAGVVTSFAYLYYKDKNVIKSDISSHLSLRIHCSELLYSEMPKLFDLKLGLTGTLDSLNEYENRILDSYGFTQRSFIPSTFQKSSLLLNNALIEEPTIVISGKKDKDYFQAIKNEVEEKIGAGRCCLVVFDTTTHLQEFQSYLNSFQRGSIRHVEILTDAMTNAEQKATISRTIFQYQVTLMTRCYGRGIDFICHDVGLREAGGVHVVFTFYPEMLAEEIQIKGRTCRQDDPGSVRKILLEQDLIHQQLLPSASSPEFIAGIGDEYLNSKREMKYREYSEKIVQACETNRIKHQKSFDLVNAIVDLDDNRAIELLQEFN